MKTKKSKENEKIETPNNHVRLPVSFTEEVIDVTKKYKCNFSKAKKLCLLAGVMLSVRQPKVFDDLVQNASLMKI